MSAREDILERVRRGVARAGEGRARGDAASRRAAALALLDRPQRGPQPVFGRPPGAAGDWADPSAADVATGLIERFQARALGQACTVAGVAHPDAVPAAVADYLSAQGLAPAAVITPELAAIDWAGAGLAVAARAAVDHDAVGISGSFCAIAETGTLMLCSDPRSPATVSLLPETHIAIVDSARIVATLEDAFALWRAEHPGPLPRAINFVSGPSRTGDIEQTIVLGAHGPCRVHLILTGVSS